MNCLYSHCIHINNYVPILIPDVKDDRGLSTDYQINQNPKNSELGILFDRKR